MRWHFRAKSCAVWNHGLPNYTILQFGFASLNTQTCGQTQSLQVLLLWLGHEMMRLWSNWVLVELSYEGWDDFVSCNARRCCTSLHPSTSMGTSPIFSGVKGPTLAKNCGRGIPIERRLLCPSPPTKCRPLSTPFNTSPMKRSSLSRGHFVPRTTKIHFHSWVVSLLSRLPGLFTARARGGFVSRFLRFLVPLVGGWSNSWGWSFRI